VTVERKKYAHARNISLIFLLISEILFPHHVVLFDLGKRVLPLRAVDSFYMDNRK